MNAFETTGYRNNYGAVETNGLLNGHEYHRAVDYTEFYTLRMVADAKGKISRVRLLSEVWPGYGRMVDISYIHATLPSGETVPVQVGADSGPLRNLKKSFIEWATREGVYAKGLGLLDEGNWSMLR